MFGACPTAFVIMGFAAIIAALLLNDISTNLTDPPTFTTVKVGPFPAKSKFLIPIAYPDIRSQAWKDFDFDTVFSACESVARGADRWEVTLVDESSGRIEAVATTPSAGFKDDVAIRVSASGKDKGKIVVDMRSVSRVGVGDVGTNARRIRAFMNDLRSFLKRS
ncbi:hypothetical protein BSKO_09517 [Bryopsis sp. KO-2023]|nr:hypothetical protein BSKO_09517 [Bryopsis sp. KO-2023]